MVYSSSELATLEKALDFHSARLGNATAKQRELASSLAFVAHVAYELKPSAFEEWICERAHSILRNARRSERVGVRRLVAKLLRPNSLGNVAMLFELSQDSDAGVRAAALETLSASSKELLREDFLPAIRKRISPQHEPHGAVRANALQLRMKYMDGELAVDLEEAKHDPDVFVRHRAVEGIAKLKLWEKMGWL